MPETRRLNLVVNIYKSTQAIFPISLFHTSISASKVADETARREPGKPEAHNLCRVHTKQQTLRLLSKKNSNSMLQEPTSFFWLQFSKICIQRTVAPITFVGNHTPANGIHYPKASPIRCVVKCSPPSLISIVCGRPENFLQGYFCGRASGLAPSLWNNVIRATHDLRPDDKFTALLPLEMPFTFQLN